MHNKSGMEGGLSLSTLSDYFDTNPVACSWLDFYDDCDGQVNAEFFSMGRENALVECRTSAVYVSRRDGLCMRPVRRRCPPKLAARRSAPT